MHQMPSITSNSVTTLRARLVAMRRLLERAFSPETGRHSRVDVLPSFGHCAAVAALVFEKLGGSLVSTNVDGYSHWFNRLPVGNRLVDIDLTGDQFGRKTVQIAKAGQLYDGTKTRAFTELDEETLARARLLLNRAEKALLTSKGDAKLPIPRSKKAQMTATSSRREYRSRSVG